ncbi:MAG TPA: terminase TerL endonuclease subunit [Candidatus Acidoferrum sp.]|jgi:phage terminase large subunit-like protein|nr:terminase TerL endonuclease subunit [Candidatus Acidoferrum sp.]
MSTKAAKALHPAEQYARDVVAGRVVASHLVVLACKRHLADLDRAAAGWLYYFNPGAGQHAIDFFAFLKHSKGEWAGQAFTLEPFQQFIIWALFGWRQVADGLRRFRGGYVELCRKNGKSTLAAGIGLYLFAADGEPGAEVYCAATKKDQARIVFLEAARMRSASPALRKRIDKFKDNMNLPGTASKFEPLGSDEDTLDGLNIHGSVVDELHAHKTRDLLDVLETATGSRRQPMSFKITTAGSDTQSVCWKEHEYSEKVLEGTVEDETVFAFIAGIDKDDDWEDERVWPKANPNLGVSCKLDDLRRKANKAKQDPTYLNTYLRLHLGRWTSQTTRWMPADKWNECVGYSLAGIDAKVLRDRLLEELRGRVCIGAIDLSSKIDLTAYMRLFLPTEDDPSFIAIPEFWMPEENVSKRVKEDRVPYDVWIREGFLRTTDGSVIDYEEIRRVILADRDVYEIKEITLDPWNATETATKLKDAGFTVSEFRQGFASMSDPMKNLMVAVLSKKLKHLGNPVLRWMSSNVAAKQDEAGNIKPDKKESREKIDGIVALIMALGRASFVPNDTSNYEKEGIFCI